MEIDYYGNNDWRDYCLAHHGIMGMHWGIRRFQPYSTTGPRKGGKTGKEIGLAGRLARGFSNARASYKKHALARKRSAALKRARKAKAAREEERRKIAAEKEDIFRSGSAERMLNRKDLFTNDEIDAFVTRRNKEALLEKIRKEQTPEPVAPPEPKKGFFEARREKKIQAEKDDINNTEKAINEQKDKKKQVIGDHAKDNAIVHQLIDLALLQNGMLKGAALDAFLKRSVELIH